MSTANVLDKQKRIIEIKWIGLSKPEEVDRLTERVLLLRSEFSSPTFKVLVDMRESLVFSKESQARLVEHQRQLRDSGMSHAAIITQKALTTMQLKRSAREAGNDTESHFENADEALGFLQSQA
ncbi:hypothetical protein [Paenibacillus urinalis]|uniref:hypothetical protein n=1 Tax=Paenibacillus urinalis TaxID=521520 RepID=UPI0019603FC7